MSMGGQGNLGGAVFTVSANTAPLTQGLQQAQGQAQQFTNMVGGQLGHASQQGSRNILQLAYAFDDLQYGFRAIVNNIPQMLMFLGPGIAGAAGIGAVAVSQLINHWEVLSRLWGDDSAKKLPELKEGIEGLTASLKEIEAQIASLQKTGKEGPNLGEIITGSGIEGQNKLNDLKAASKEAKEKLAAERAVGGIEGTEAQDATGAAVKKAIRGTKGGVDALMDILTDRGMSPDDAKKAIAGALGGNEAHLDDILGKLTDKEKAGQFAGLAGAGQGPRAAVEQKRLDLEGGRNDRKNVEKLDKQAQKEKEDQAKLELDGRKRDKEMVHKLAENAKRERIQELEDQRDQIMNRKHAINEAFSPTQILSGAKSVVDMYQQAAGNSKRDQLLMQANKELQGIHEELKKERRVRPT